MDRSHTAYPRTAGWSVRTEGVLDAMTRMLLRLYLQGRRPLGPGKIQLLATIHDEVWRDSSKTLGNGLDISHVDLRVGSLDDFVNVPWQRSRRAGSE